MNKFKHFYRKKYKVIIHIFSVLLFFSILYTLFFSPVLFSHRLLAPGDGIIQSVPAFYSPRILWTNIILSGFPVAADPQVQTWYPLAIFFSFIPNSWNCFVISAYVLASCFSYGYVYTITNSKLAAIVSGIIYGMSGFMMAHLGHTMMIHTALWMPLLIWALEKLRHNFSPNWLLIGVLAVSCSILAGHPQIFVYSIGLSAAYVFILGWFAPIGRWTYYRLYLGIMILGVALAAMQILPTIELTNLSLRSAITFQEFVTYSLPLHQTIQLIFPYLFGTHNPSFYQLPYFGEWNLTELTGYIGLLPLLLATVGFLTYWNKSIRWFWFGVCLLTLLLILGDATPLAQLMYHLPAYDKFRVPARHFVEMALGVSVLAGLGIATLQKQTVSNRLVLKTVLVSTSIMIVSLIGIFLFSDQLKKKVINAGVGQLTLLPWLNPAVGVPLVIFAMAATTLIYWSKSTQSKFRGLLILVILVLDLGSFGWFYEWSGNSAPSTNLITPTVSTLNYKQVLNASHQRMLPMQGAIAAIDTIPPNISRLWGVPSASGYGPLGLSRYSQLLSINPNGMVSQSVLPNSDQSLNITATKYIFLPKSLTNSIAATSENLNISLGSGCGIPNLNSIKLQVPSQSSATGINIVSSLGCSTAIPNNAEVLQILVKDSKGKVVNQSLRAGRDTSEWAHSCSDVLPFMKHGQAPIFESFPVERKPFSCEGHRYVSNLALDKLNDVKNVELDWVASSGAISIHKINLIDDETKRSYPITEVSGLLNTTRWNHIEDINVTSVYKNLQAMPRAWLVPEVISAKPDDILKYIKSSQLPGGRYYEPSKVAFVEEPLELKPQEVDLYANAKISKLSDTKVEVITSSSSPAFLVLSDIYYPGWQATVDGKNAHIFQTNYVLRGLLVPGGEHTVKFEFKPISFHLGLGISAASLALLGYFYLKLKQNQKNFIGS